MSGELSEQETPACRLHHDSMHTGHGPASRCILLRVHLL